GVEQVYVIKFNKELSLVEPKDFIDHFIVGLNIIHLVAGFDYSYGHKGKGNMSNIEEDTQNRFTYETIHKVEHNEDKIRSNKKRKRTCQIKKKILKNDIL